MSIRDLTPWSGHRHGASRSMTGLPVENFYRGFDKLFENFFHDFGISPEGRNGGEGGALVPSIDVAETEKAFEVKAELPGVEQKDVEVTIADDVLTIKGEKKSEEKEEGKNFYRSERSYGSFARAISLPPSVNEDKISAAFKNGVLTVTLPKSAEAKKATKKVSVKAA